MQLTLVSDAAEEEVEMGKKNLKKKRRKRMKGWMRLWGSEWGLYRGIRNAFIKEFAGAVCSLLIEC